MGSEFEFGEGLPDPSSSRDLSWLMAASLFPAMSMATVSSFSLAEEPSSTASWLLLTDSAIACSPLPEASLDSADMLSLDLSCDFLFISSVECELEVAADSCLSLLEPSVSTVLIADLDFTAMFDMGLSTTVTGLDLSFSTAFPELCGASCTAIALWGFVGAAALGSFMGLWSEW